MGALLVGFLAAQVWNESDRASTAVGAEEDVAPPSLSRAYHDAAVRAGKQATLRLLPGEGHDILMVPAVFAALDSLVQQVPS